MTNDKFQVVIRSESRFPVNRRKIREVAVQMLKQSKAKGKINVEICIVGDRKMRQLNKKYRGIDSPTPTLTFALEDPHQACQRINILQQSSGSKIDEITPFVQHPDGILRLGSVVISFPQARSLAAEQQMMVDDKISELVRHGMKILLRADIS